MSAEQTGTASGSTSLLPDEYDSLIERVRDAANAMIPRNATVLVVSRGDEELLRLGPRRGLHFPQDEFGRYAGYHPQDSDAAISLLEEMRARGADYLLLPSTSFWWLDYYEGLREHLDRNYPTLVAADECMVFELLSTGSQSGALDADTTRMAGSSSQRLAAPLDELLRALVPVDARIAVVATGTTDLPSFEHSRSVRAPDGSGGLAALVDEAGDADFLVIPATAYDRVYGGQQSADTIGPWRLVTRQRHMCEIFERVEESGGTVAPDPAARDDVPAADGPAVTERRGLWQRIRDAFRGS